MNETRSPAAGAPRAVFAARVRTLTARYAPQLLLAIAVVVFLIIKPSTLSGSNILNILVDAAPIAVLGLGAMWVLIGGGLDLSAGYGVAMCSLVLATGLQHGDPLPLAICMALGAGIALGLVNGLLVGLIGMPAFIATLATMVAVEGITLVLGNIGTVIIDNSTLNTLGIGKVVGIPIPIIYAAGLAAIVWLLSRFTRFGLRTYSIGSNRAATAARGVPVVRQTLLIYVFGGVMTAATALLLVAHVQVVDPNIAGIDLLLDAFAATILGGTSLFGGRGSVVGTITGAVIISLITTGLVTLGVGPQNVDLLKGVMIVVAVVVDALVRTLERRGARTRAVPA